MRLVRRLAGAVLLLAGVSTLQAQDLAPRRIDSTRFTVLFFPGDARLASSILRAAVANDSFPWLPRPKAPAVIAIAPDEARFRQWVGPDAPEWGAAIAFPESNRIVMHGHAASSEAGNPIEVIRHELAHLALHEFMGNLPPRWFDEGYASLAAREWRRDDVLAANIGLALRGTPTLARIDSGFHGGSLDAQASYAFSYRAVRDLALRDPERGLTLFFQYWSERRSLDDAVRRAFGVTLAGFEKVFQDNTRRTYGMLALVADFSLLAVILLLLMFPFMFARRTRDKRRLKAMLAADAAAEKAAQESAIMFLLQETPTDRTSDSADDADRADEQKKD